MKIFYFDLETTGVMHWKNGIHQISGAIEIDGVVKEYFDYKVCPHSKCLIEPGALAVGNVTEDQIKAYPDMKKVYADLILMLSRYVDKFDKKDKFFLCGYNNAGFDNNFFRAFFVQNFDNYFGSWFWSSHLDAMVLAGQKLMNVRADMIDFKQATVAKQLGIEVDESKLHDAEYDVNLLIQIYKKVI